MGLNPKIKPHLTTIDKVIGITVWAILLVIWTVTLLNYSSLPGKIPIHFNLEGVTDGFSSKISILIWPALATVLCLGLTLLARLPHIFKYPVEITQENAPTLYARTSKTAGYISLTTVMAIGLVQLNMIHFAIGETDKLWPFSPIAFALIFIPLILFLSRLFRGRPK